MVKRFFVLCVLIVFIFTAASCGNSDESNGTEELITLAGDFVQLLSEGDYATAFESLNADMQDALPESELQATWELVLSQVGDYEGEVNKRTDQVDGYHRVLINSEFETATIDIIVVFDNNNEIAGLFFQ